jgi:hypothetical protein
LQALVVAVLTQTPTLTAALVAVHLVLLVGNSLVAVGLEGHKLRVVLHLLPVPAQVVLPVVVAQDTGVGMAAIHLLVPFTALVAVALALLLGQTPRTQQGQAPVLRTPETRTTRSERATKNSQAIS